MIFFFQKLVFFYIPAIFFSSILSENFNESGYNIFAGASNEGDVNSSCDVSCLERWPSQWMQNSLVQFDQVSHTDLFCDDLSPPPVARLLLFFLLLYVVPSDINLPKLLCLLCDWSISTILAFYGVHKPVFCDS